MARYHIFKIIDDHLHFFIDTSDFQEAIDYIDNHQVYNKEELFGYDTVSNNSFHLRAPDYKPKIHLVKPSPEEE